MHRLFHASQHAKQRLIIRLGHSGQGIDHTIDLKKQLPAFLLHHLRNERPVVIIDLLQIGL